MGKPVIKLEALRPALTTLGEAVIKHVLGDRDNVSGEQEVTGIDLEILLNDVVAAANEEYKKAAPAYYACSSILEVIGNFNLLQLVKQCAGYSYMLVGMAILHAAEQFSYAVSDLQAVVYAGESSTAVIKSLVAALDKLITTVSTHGEDYPECALWNKHIHAMDSYTTPHRVLTAFSLYVETYRKARTAGEGIAEEPYNHLREALMAHYVETEADAMLMTAKLYADYCVELEHRIRSRESDKDITFELFIHDAEQLKEVIMERRVAN